MKVSVGTYALPAGFRSWRHRYLFTRSRYLSTLSTISGSRASCRGHVGESHHQRAMPRKSAGLDRQGALARAATKSGSGNGAANKTECRDRSPTAPISCRAQGSFIPRRLAMAIGSRWRLAASHPQTALPGNPRSSKVGGWLKL
jgi:hypothetical protein